MNKRILLVDDDESTMMVASTILQMNGYEVIGLSSCKDIIEYVEKHQPSLVLMDVWLPGTGGEYAAKTLKNTPSTSHVPVILFSGEQEIYHTVERVGAEGAISKPIDMLEFANTVAQYIPENSNGN